MKQIVTGIVAHVDAGKTTLSEALLYQTETVRKLGRVDNGDTFLDSSSLEQKRGITIFSHQANLQYGDLALTLLDTPGHMDFASQTEQVLSVLDYAILVVSATDGVRGYTRTLWHLLERYNIPTFIFVNKMDVEGADQSVVLQDLQSNLADGCVAFDASELTATTQEEIAMQTDEALEEFMAAGALSDQTVQQLIQRRQVFPVYFGAALKLAGVDELLAGMAKWSQEVRTEREFGARVFKVSHDDHGERLTWLRVTGGTLQPKMTVWKEQKINQLRTYNGAKFANRTQINAGEVCAVTGLTDTYPGQGLGNQADALNPMLQPVLNYAVQPNDEELPKILAALQELGDEDPQLHVQWDNQLQEIRVQLMGAVQLEVLQQILLSRFGLQVEFGEGSILYRETITEPVEGVGHFEPLRHYAEVHLLMEPAPAGSGLTLEADCPVDVLGKNWQHQVLANLAAKEQLGVLIGSQLTDVKITLINGRASNVHTVGGDFREATWRAVRQGLMMLKQRGACQLLEPWYQFRLEVGNDQVGRALNDIQKMNGTFDLPPNAENAEMTTIVGTAPVAEMQDYSQSVNAYTHGQGQLECVFAGYQPCHNEADVVATIDYDPVADVANTPDSVFCAHGAGYPVKWDDVPQMAHVEYR